MDEAEIKARIARAVLSERIACARVAANNCSCKIHYKTSPNHFAECELAQEILLAREEQEAKGQ